MKSHKNGGGWRRVLRVGMIWALPLLALLPLSFIVLGQISQTRPDNLGLHNGALAPLALTPNGVSSQSPDAAHFIEPLRFNKSAAEGKARLKEVLRRCPRATLVRENEVYLHVEFRSPWFHFVDDVEFLIADRVIHLRSASRVGKSDLGVNRRRLESLRVLFNEPSPWPGVD